MRRTLVLLSSAALVAGLSLVAPAVASAASATSLPDSHPSWARPANKVAAAAPGTRIGFSVYLKIRDRAGAEAAAAAVSDPGSPSYRQYLSPAQVRARYAATDATVQRVRQWLGAAGFTVGATASNNAYVEAAGTVAQIQRAFAVHVNTYSVRGHHRRGVDADLQLPPSIASSVLSVSGLTQSVSRPLDVPPPDGFRNAPPCGRLLRPEDRHHGSCV